MHVRLAAIASVPCVLAALAACSGGTGGGSGAGADVAADAPGPVVTYAVQIKPLLDAHCVSCHASTVHGDARHGAPDGKDYDTYDGAKAAEPKLTGKVEGDTMPIDAATSQPTPLSAPDKALFQAWLDQGLLP